MPATAKSPAATEPMFFVAAPVKPAAPADPVFDGATGAIGEPVAAAPEPAPEPKAAPEAFAAPDAPDVPVGAGAVPVAKPVEPAMAVELWMLILWLYRKKRKCIESYLMAAVFVHEHTVS